MTWMTKLPLLGNLLGKIFDRLCPDKASQKEKVLEIELEEVRQSKGRITPRMLLKYIVACGVGLYLLMSLAMFFFPELGPLPDWLEHLMPLAGLLFGFGN